MAGRDIALPIRDHHDALSAASHAAHSSAPASALGIRISKDLSSPQNTAFDLPPTPPQNVNQIDADAAATNDPDPVSYQTSPNALSGMSTPTNKKSLPTPDTTPPKATSSHASDNPTVNNSPQSSMENSFQTAREGVPSPQERLQHEGPPQGVVTPVRLPSSNEAFRNGINGVANGVIRNHANGGVNGGFNGESQGPEPLLRSPPRPQGRLTPSLKHKPDVKALVGHWENEYKRFSVTEIDDLGVRTTRTAAPRRASEATMLSQMSQSLALSSGEPSPLLVEAQHGEDELPGSTYTQSEQSPQLIHEQPFMNNNLLRVTGLGIDSLPNKPFIEFAPPRSKPRTPEIQTSREMAPIPDKFKTIDINSRDSAASPSPLTPRTALKFSHRPDSGIEPSPISPSTPPIDQSGIGPRKEASSPAGLQDFYKRFSSGSNSSSTVVDAIIIDSRPSSTKHQLRRVSKHEALRPQLGSSDKSNRSSFNSDELSPHRLVRKKNLTPERRISGNKSVDLGQALFSSQLSAQPQDQSGRPKTAPHVMLQLPQETQHSPQRPAEQNGGMTRDFIPPALEDDKKSKRSFSEPLQPQEFLTSRSFRPDQSSKTGSLEIPIIYEGHPALENLREVSRAPMQRSVGEDYPSPSTAKSESFPKGSASATASPKAMRRSMDRSTAKTESLYRPSFEQQPITLRLDDPNSPQMYTLHSPVTIHSNFSALEVREASAVTIFPHTNNSLLMVHHNSLDNPLQAQQDPSTAQNMFQQAFLAGEASPSKPTFGPIIEVNKPVDTGSSLPNSQLATEPPMVAVIPPTPARELEEADEETTSIVNSKQSEMPRRRSSAIQRGRRHSGSIIPSIVSSFGGGSLRRQNTRTRYYYGGKRATSRRISSAPNAGRRDTTLHPLWRPRHFWDGYDSCSDEDDDYDNNNHDDNDFNDTNKTPVSRKLPPGGDTRESAGPGLRKYNDNAHWRRVNSLRGFLIGNTLGLERGPTNRRRHIVALPSNMLGQKVVPRRRPSKRAPGSPSIVTVRDSVRRSGSARKHRARARAGVSTRQATQTQKGLGGDNVLVRAWRDMVEQRRQHKLEKHEAQNL